MLPTSVPYCGAEVGSVTFVRERHLSLHFLSFLHFYLYICGVTSL